MNTGGNPDRAEACPAPELLEALHLGKLPEPAAESIAAHLETCARCQSTLAELEGRADSLIEGIRQTGATEAPVSPACARAVARVAALVSDIPPMSLTAPPSTVDFPTRPVPFGGYELLERLGQGGMGAVYKARNPKLKKTVALKVLPPERVGDPRAVARFLREMEAVGRMEHPNVVRALDAGEVAGVHYLAMEYVEGLDLGRLVERCGPLPLPDACELICQAAAGLQAAHQIGLIHRDVKPSNLILAASGEVKVLDLGLARLETTELPQGEATGTGQVIGTPDYMAPEQALESHKADVRADVYSLGCTLYKLLTGRAPFTGAEYDTPLKKVTGHARDSAPPLRRFRPEAPDGLMAALDAMLAKNPAQRPATPREAADQLKPYAAGADLAGLLARALGDWPAEQCQRSGPGRTPADPRSCLTETPAASPAPSLSAADESGRPARQPAAASIRKRRWPAWAVALVAVVVLGAALLRIAVRTPRGVLILDFPEGVPTDAEVYLDGQEVVLRKLDGSRGEIVFSEGEYGLRVVHGDREFQSDGKLVVRGRKGAGPPVRVTWTPRSAPIPPQTRAPDPIDVDPTQSMTGVNLANTFAAEVRLGWPMELKWRYPAGRTGWTYPVAVHGNRVYVGNTGDGALHAVDPADGTLLWSAGGQGRVLEAPAWFDGVLYCTANRPDSTDGRIVAIDPATGKVLWTWANEVGVRLPRGPSPRIFAGLLHTGTIDVNVGFLAVEPQTGKTAWYRRLGVPDGAYGLGYCAVSEEHGLLLYISDATGELYALDARSGDERWRFRSGVRGNASGPAVVGDQVCFTFGLVEKRIYCVDVRSGTERWQRPLSASRGYSSNLCVGDGKVIARTASHELVAFRVDDGELAWRTPLEPGTGMPLVAGRIVFCTNRGFLNAFDLQTGKLLGSVQAQDGWLSAAATGLAVRAHETGDVLWFVPSKR